MKKDRLSQEEIEQLFKEAVLGFDDGPRQPAYDTGKPAAADGTGHSSESEVAEIAVGDSGAADYIEVTPQIGDSKQNAQPSIRAAEFEEFQMEPVSDKPISDIDVLMDIPLTISVELGRSKCFVKDLLNLTAGSIVELDRLAGDPVDILVNGKLFAKGEVVVIDENFGVRIQEVLGKDKRR